MKKETFLLKHLNCPTCAGDLERGLKRLPGVNSVDVTFATGTLTLEYDEVQVGEAQVKRLIEGFGMQIDSRL